MKKLLTEWRKYLNEVVITPEMGAIGKAFLASPSHAMFLMDSLGDEEMSMYLGHDLRRVVGQIKRFDAAIEEVLSGNTTGRAYMNVGYALSGIEQYMTETTGGIFKRDDIKNFIEPLKFLEDQVVRRKLSRESLENAVKNNSEYEAKGYLHLKDIIEGL